MDEDSQFEIVDYTTASPFEKLLVSLEQTLSKWFPNGAQSQEEIPNAQQTGKRTESEWSIGRTFSKQEKLLIDGKLDFLLVLSHSNSASTLPSRFLATETTDGHQLRLHRWSGFESLLLVLPFAESLIGKPQLNEGDESREKSSIGQSFKDHRTVKLLSSAFSIVLSNTSLSIPVFFPIHPSWSELYQGIMVRGDRNIHYRTTHLQFKPREFSSFSSLKRLFMTRFKDHDSDKLKLIVLARFTFRLNFQTFRINSTSRSTDYPSVIPLNTHDFIEKILVSFENNDENCEMVDGDRPVDFDKTKAFVKVEGTFDCESVRNELQIFKMFERFALAWIDEFHVAETRSERSFQIGIGDLLQRRSSSSAGITLVDGKDVENILKAVFTVYQVDFSDLKCLNQRNSVPYRSIIWTLCVELAKLLNGYYCQEHMIPSVSAFLAVLWPDLIKVIRWHWETLTPLPNLSIHCDLVDGNEIDLNLNLLHQKLSMVDICIREARLRNPRSSDCANIGHPLFSENQPASSEIGDVVRDNSNLPDEWKWDNSDEENAEVFYDTTEDVKTRQYEECGSHSSSEREGALTQCGQLRLLRTGQPLMIPKTQSLPPCTEDMVQAQQEILENLGTSEEAAKIRAKMQSTQLLSDMEAFKAANPGAVLEDFVRWHSPRDFIESADGNGELSTRMREDGNLWRSLWESAKPIPAQKQEPIFNPIQEAEKAIHWMESLDLKNLLKFLFPVLLGVLNETLESWRTKLELTSINSYFTDYKSAISTIDWKKDASEFTFEEIRHLGDSIMKLEHLLLLVSSLQDKVGFCPDLIKIILSQYCHSSDEFDTNICQPYQDNEIAVLNAAIKNKLESFIRRDNLNPLISEYVFEMKTSNSNETAERLYAKISDNEFRILETIQNDRTIYTRAQH